MGTNKKIGAAVALITPLIAAIGLLVGYLSIQHAIGLAIVAIVIGTGVARGAFSSTPGANRNS